MEAHVVHQTIQLHTWYAGGICVKGVAAGIGHTVVCGEAGEVYAFGWNAEGQLGTGDTQTHFQPRLIDSPVLENKHVVQVRKSVT